MKMIVFFSGNRIPNLPKDMVYCVPKALDAETQTIMVTDENDPSVEKYVESRINMGYTAVVFNAVEVIKIEPQVVKKSLI